MNSEKKSPRLDNAIKAALIGAAVAIIALIVNSAITLFIHYDQKDTPPSESTPTVEDTIKLTDTLTVVDTITVPFPPTSPGEDVDEAPDANIDSPTPIAMNISIPNQFVKGTLQTQDITITDTEGQDIDPSPISRILSGQQLNQPHLVGLKLLPGQYTLTLSAQPCRFSFEATAAASEAPAIPFQCH